MGEIEVRKEFGGKLKLIITDSGAGIDPATAEKMMQPFFTTKPVGQGTGLGLSISLGLIRDHGGTLSLDSTSKNTCFVLELPLVQAKAERREAS